MGAALIPLVCFTVFWILVGFVVPFFIRGPNRGITRVCLMLTSVSAWLFWVCCYLSQMNPLIGPKLTKESLLLMAREWGKEVSF